MIGSFFPARKLYYWPEFVQYLPENQYNSGLAEAFKTALLFDKELYNLFKNEADKINARDRETLETIITKSVREKDFTEQGVRATLNLGHTFGHALESVAGLGKITHGAAVAWGIGRAVTLSFKKEYCREAFMNEIFDVLKLYGWDTSPVPGAIFGGGSAERLLKVMHKDKKNLTSSIRLIIQKGLQDTVIEEVSDAEILSVLK
jgi:3-dehydroquinate synthase